MHVHILGIGGTFMAGIAQLALELGMKVTGQDKALYPPMSDVLAKAGIEVVEGYEYEPIADLKPDCVVVGNALKRGDAVIEGCLDNQVALISGPAWLYEHVLKNRWVIAIAGTHGKTTTSSMVTWLLDQAGLNPGYLIGGVPSHSNQSAKLGESFFVIEADEYDTAFFDKRSKFVHYWPKTCVLNNLEFDHADIFDDLKAIQKQCHHLVRLVPPSGKLIVPANVPAIGEVLAMGTWAPVESLHSTNSLQAANQKADGSRFEVTYRGKVQGEVHWSCTGDHNVHNGLSALACAMHVGVELTQAMEALSQFKLPKRRMESLGVYRGIHLYDDFAHHPTAIASTLSGLRASKPNARIGVLLDLGSNTMRAGHHQHTLMPSLKDADLAGVFVGNQVQWAVDKAAQGFDNIQVFEQNDGIIEWFMNHACENDHWIIMSNGGFMGLSSLLPEKLSNLDARAG